MLLCTASELSSAARCAGHTLQLVPCGEGARAVALGLLGALVQRTMSRGCISIHVAA